MREKCRKMILVKLKADSNFEISVPIFRITGGNALIQKKKTFPRTNRPNRNKK